MLYLLFFLLLLLPSCKDKVLNDPINEFDLTARGVTVNEEESKEEVQQRRKEAQKEDRQREHSSRTNA
jgi:hypothetical protein